MTITWVCLKMMAIHEAIQVDGIGIPYAKTGGFPAFLFPTMMGFQWSKIND